MRSSILLRALTLGILALPSCTYVSEDLNVYVTSTPPGAEIYLDGENTGETTPAMLDLSGSFDFGGTLGSDRQVTIKKTGFEPEERTLHHHGKGYTSKWVDGVASEFLWVSFPLFWTFGDFFTPFATRATYVPRTLHVRLYPEGEAPGN